VSDRAATHNKSTQIEGAAGPQIPAGDITQFEIRFDYVRDALRDILKPIGLKGRVRQLDAHIHQVGMAGMGLADVPIYLARALAAEKLLENADRLLRGESSRARGIVFVPQAVRFPYIGCHVVLSLDEHIDSQTGLIDADAIRVAYEASVDPAARGAAVHFRKQGEDAAQLIVLGQDPWIIVGAKKVKLVERLYIGHRDREPGVKLSILKQYAGFSGLSQLFGTDWKDVNNRFIYSPNHSFWALRSEPISH
jgi:hypothetical protein